MRAVRRPGTRVVCLIRAATDAEADRRLSETLADMAVHHTISVEERSRIVALRGDITQPRLGLSAAAWESLAAEATRIVHGAASVSWSLPLEEARRINTGGTREMLQLAHAAARHGRLQAFDYLSTVMVAGRRKGSTPEKELDDTAGFWSTFRAEQVRRRARGLGREATPPRCPSSASVWWSATRGPDTPRRSTSCTGR